MSDFLNLGSISKTVESRLGPPFKWCRIQGGEVILEDDSLNGGTGSVRYRVNNFAISKYPITNAQYQRFLEHPKGFSNPDWWGYSLEAMQWRRDHKNPRPTAFFGAELPRTRVSWFDSLAFCQWLSDELDNQTRSKMPPDPCNIFTWGIRLPTEQEWQRAALGDTGWNYPWGNELNDNRANYGRNIGQPSGVDKYPDGKSVFSVMDMIGNVWEWCLTGWNQEITNASGYTYRIIKGGAWNINNPDHLRANDRGCHPPRGSLNDCGFRMILCDQPIHKANQGECK